MRSRGGGGGEGDAREGVEGQEGGGAEQEQHEHAGGEDLCGEVVSEGEDGEFDECVTADGKAAVRLVRGGAVRSLVPRLEQAETVVGGQVLGDGQGLRGIVGMVAGTVDVSLVHHVQERRGQRDQQQQQGQASGPEIRGGRHPGMFQCHPLLRWRPRIGVRRGNHNGYRMRLQPTEWSDAQKSIFTTQWRRYGVLFCPILMRETG